MSGIGSNAAINVGDTVRVEKCDKCTASVVYIGKSIAVDVPSILYSGRKVLAAKGDRRVKVKWQPQTCHVYRFSEWQNLSALTKITKGDSK